MNTGSQILIGFVTIIILITAFSIIAPMIQTAGDKIGESEQRCNDQPGCIYNASLSDASTDIDALTGMTNATAKNLQYKALGTTCFVTQVYDINETANLTAISYTVNNCTIVPKTDAHNGDDWNVTYIYTKAGGSEPCRNSDYQALACGSGEPYVPPLGNLFKGTGIVIFIFCAMFLLLIVNSILKRR